MKVKKIPQRTCIGCRSVHPKKELIRIVRTHPGVGTEGSAPECEVAIDPTGKKSGRGAYICPNPNCLELAFKGAQLDKALEITITNGVKEHLRTEISSLIK